MDIKTVAGTAFLEGEELVSMAGGTGKLAPRRGGPGKPEVKTGKVFPGMGKGKKGKLPAFSPKLVLSNNKLKFYVDKNVGKVIVQVIDPETLKIIRQIPSEENLRMLKQVHEFLGQLINGKA